jgi:hypothetical protein
MTVAIEEIIVPSAPKQSALYNFASKSYMFSYVG